jgi:hypothetical protein
MLACRILNILVSVFSIVTVPLQLLTTLVGGCLVSCTFGLLLLPLSIIWMVLLGLLLGTSWLWERAECLGFGPLVVLAHIPLAVVGIPLALVSETYVSLVPSMGEIESRYTKLVTCWVWPFSLDYWRFRIRRSPVDTPENQHRFARLVGALHIAAPDSIDEFSRLLAGIPSPDVSNDASV